VVRLAALTRARAPCSRAAARASIVARLTLDDLDELLGAVAAEANHATDANLQKRLDTICERLRDIEEIQGEAPSEADLRRYCKVSSQLQRLVSRQTGTVRVHR
jgi:hypothetical protein